MRKNILASLLAAGLGCLLCGCSLTSVAVMALSSGGGKGNGALSTFMREDDPEIVADALPTLIKTLEMLQASEPKDPNLNLTVGSAYVMYANAFLEGPSNRMGDDQYEQKQLAKARAKNFYARGAAYVRGALERKFPGITLDAAKTAKYLPKLTKSWVPYLYWYSAGTCAAFNLDPINISFGQQVPSAKLLMERAGELDPNFMNGAIFDFFISFHAGMPDTLGGDKSKVEYYYKKALEISKGAAPGPYVSYATGVCVPAQDAARFKEELGKALAINPDDNPDSRLMIILTQRNARYYLDHIEDYILVAE